MARRPEITLTQLRYFAAAADKGSMTEAAKEFYVAQSAVSAAISQLEAQLGVQLFIRQRSKGLTLAPAGVQFQRDVRTVLQGLEGAVDTVRGIDHQVRGTVRVGCFITLAPFLVPDLIARARERHPQLEVVVEELDAADAREALRSGRVELHIGYDFALGSDVQREVITLLPAHLVLPIEHPLAAQEKVFLREVAREPFVLLDLPYSREYFLGLLARAGIDPDICYRSSTYETVRSMVAHGQGLSMLNLHPSTDVTYDGLRVACRPIGDELPALPLVLATTRGTRRSARARAVGHLATETVRDVLGHVH
ncbi:LysR family transcriptional regulator [Brachybacterium sp. AOP25-B2-12]|uniref:LysR family transcriptional regulator n=1 Tax=Brachybacterium sp. AOP25-B2-12 TaxID=3457710 RepID=UPI004034142F